MLRAIATADASLFRSSVHPFRLVLHSSLDEWLPVLVDNNVGSVVRPVVVHQSPGLIVVLDTLADVVAAGKNPLLKRCQNWSNNIEEACTHGPAALETGHVVLDALRVWQQVGSVVVWAVDGQ
jgi:hypothetical protein